MIARPASCGKNRTSRARATVAAAASTSSRQRAAAAEPHRAAAPAEGDPAVARRPEVVEQGAAVGDRLAARPADLLEHVRDGLGQDDVAGRDRERRPEPGPAGGGRVDREHRGAGAHTACRRSRPSRPARARRPVSARRSGRRARAAWRAARARAARAGRWPRWRSARRSGRPARRRSPGPPLRVSSAASASPSSRQARRTGSQAPSCAAVVATSSCGAAVYHASTSLALHHSPIARTDSADASTNGQRPLVAERVPQPGQVAPERLHEAAVPPARPVTADSGFEHDHVCLRLELEQMPGGPEAEVAAADDDDVRGRLPCKRRGRLDRPCLLEPPAGRRVPHRPILRSARRPEPASGAGYPVPAAWWR